MNSTKTATIALFALFAAILMGTSAHAKPTDAVELTVAHIEQYTKFVELGGQPAGAQVDLKFPDSAASEQLCSKAGFSQFAECVAVARYVNVLLTGYDYPGQVYRQPREVMAEHIEDMQQSGLPADEIATQVAVMREVVELLPTDIPTRHIDLMNAHGMKLAKLVIPTE